MTIKDIFAEYERLMLLTRFISQLPLILIALFIGIQIYEMLPNFFTAKDTAWQMAIFAMCSKLLILFAVILRLILLLYRSRLGFNALAVSWFFIFIYLIALTLNEYYQQYLEEQEGILRGFEIYILVPADPFPFALIAYVVFSIIRFSLTLGIATFRVRKSAYDLV